MIPSWGIQLIGVGVIIWLAWLIYNEYKKNKAKGMDKTTKLDRIQKEIKDLKKVKDLEKELEKLKQ